ncbi:MAG: hypothetical protein RMM08_10200 [Armatimonadota bacterium]|nr:hypothetical protein [bacterium]MDW8321723.1 hypothetical protein [Armatimonadota bacterium]
MQICAGKFRCRLLLFNGEAGAFTAKRSVVSLRTCEKFSLFTPLPPMYNMKGVRLPNRSVRKGTFTDALPEIADL